MVVVIFVNVISAILIVVNVSQKLVVMNLAALRPTAKDG